MGVVERINARMLERATGSLPSARRRDGGWNLSFDDWAAMFSYGGVAYPLIQTTMGSIKEERIPVTAIAAFETNAAVFALTQARVQAFSQIRFQWTRFSGAQPGKLFGTPELNVLEHPWPNGDTGALLSRMEIDNSIAGNSFTVRPRKNRVARLRPDRVIICLGSQTDAEVPSDAPDVEIAGYYFWPQSGQGKAFLPEEVAHYAPIPDPTFQFLGISWMTAAVREIQGDSLMTEHKNRFMTNAATPNLAIKFDPSIPIDKVRAFKDQMEEDHKGAWNAYKTLYMGGGADPVAIGKDFQQIAFSDTLGHGESRLAAAAGVPASWVGFSEGLKGSSLNAGNFNSARRRFSDGTMQHLWMNAAMALSAIVRPPDTNARLWFDSRVPFMRDDATDIAAIQAAQSTAIANLTMQGYDPVSIVTAIAQNDMSLLKHTGLASVQLQSGGGQPPLKTPGAPPGGGQNGAEPATVSDKPEPPSRAAGVARLVLERYAANGSAPADRKMLLAAAREVQMEVRGT